MPKIPDLEAQHAFIIARVVGVTLAGVELIKPWIIRQGTAEGVPEVLIGNAVARVERRGKFLLMHLRSGHIFAINAMLTGRLRYRLAGRKRSAWTAFVLTLADGHQLAYEDHRFMGKWHLVPEGGSDLIPNFAKMGPEALDVSYEEFSSRLRRYSGQIKNILVNAEFVAGIGNAYSDEILFEAETFPFHKRATLSNEEVHRLHAAIHSVLAWATPIVQERTEDHLETKIRDFLRVHRQGGEACPRCGGNISEVSSSGRVTSFCRTCQPEGDRSPVRPSA